MNLKKNEQGMQVMNPMLTQQVVLGVGGGVGVGVGVGGGSNINNSEDGTKLYISNLEYGVTNDDIKVYRIFIFIFFIMCLIYYLIFVLLLLLLF